MEESHSTDHDDDDPDGESSPRAPGHAPTVAGYEILGELGRGGMGVVYKARHVKANRVVALKMILAKQHASLKQMVRFQIEVEAVARLHHPHIVHLHEVGEHDGLPFFSLEYCEGGTLAQSLKDRRPTARKSAALVEKLARAIHHAHTRGVVHRDLKPANVLLTAEGKPKITDFGLARRLDEDGEVSRSGAVLGTPNYMAPEQAAGRTDDTGPATDVYALGAILYECLTGRPPFEGPSAAVLVDVLEREPLAPTVLRSDVPRDLETICLKCLHKDAGRRYDSAEALADDLRRWQRGEPIRARPVGVVERAVKWVGRNPVVIGMAAILIGVILVAGAGLWWKFAEARKHRRAAEDLAEEFREEKEGIERQLRAARFETDEIRRNGVDGELRRQWAEERAAQAIKEADRLRTAAAKERAAAEQARRAEQAAAKQRQVAVEAAAMLAADIHDRLKGRPELKALHQGSLNRALAELHELVRGTDLGMGATRDVARQVLRLSLELGDSYLTDGRDGHAEARRQYERAFDLAGRLNAAEPGNVAGRRDLANARTRLGDVDRESGHLERAVLHYRLARAIREELVNADPRDDPARRELAACHEKLGDVRLRLDEPRAAAIDFREALSLYERLLAAAPDDRTALRGLATVAGRLGDALLRLGEGATALSMCEMSRAVLLRLVTADPRDDEARQSLAGAHERIGDLRLKRGNADLAVEDYRQALEIRRLTADAAPDDVKSLRALADAFDRVAVAEEQRGDDEAAVQARRRSIDINQRVAQVEPNDAHVIRNLFVGYRSLGDLSLAAFDFRQAVFWFENAAAVHKRLPNESAPVEELNALEARLRACREIVTWLDRFRALSGTE